MAADTIIHRFLNQAQTRPHAKAYHVKEGASWKATTWSKYVEQVQTAARALITLGVSRKHGTDDPPTSVCVLGFNRPEWVISDLATMAVGGAPAGIYTTCSPSEVAYIIGHTEARLVVVENEMQWKKVEQEREQLPALKHVVVLDGADDIDDDMVLSWSEFLAKADETSEETLSEYIDALSPDEMATLIYTSGTTGPPKGVMLSHANLSWTAQCADDMIQTGPSDCVVSYLPLSHIAEQMFTIHAPATSGMQVYFAESIDKVKDNFAEVRPTVLFAVPRIWEKFYAGVSAKLGQATGVKAKLVGWARDTGTEVNNLRNRGQEPGFLLAQKYNFFNSKIYGPLKAALGLDRAKICVSGAAPISQEIIEFFASLDLVIREVYGQSEGSGPTSFNLPNRTKYGSVGPAIPGCTVKIAEDDEILAKGPNIFLGYYKDTEATDATLVDGWLHSGDLGRVDGEGYLHITGRKKDLIITAGGKNIAPKNIESALKDLNVVGEAVVIGDRRKYLTALISLDQEAAETYAKENGLSEDELPEHAPLLSTVQSHVDKVNQDLARVEQIKKFAITPRPFSIEDGELTPTLKVKRNKVNANFAELIESLYEA